MSGEPFGNRLPRIRDGGFPSEICLADVLEGIAKGQPVQVLRGAPGCGKSAVLRALRRHLSKHAMVVLLNTGLLNASEFLGLILCEANLESDVADSDAMKGSLRALAGNCAKSGRRLVVLVDEAMYLPTGSLTAMLELAVAERPGDGDLQFVLASVDSLLDRISAAHPGTLPAGLVREIEIDPMQLAQVETYIRNELSAAGLEPNIFTEEAIHAAALRSRSVVRILNRVCHDAMRVASNLGSTKVFARHFWISDIPADWFLSDAQSAAGARAASASRRAYVRDETAMAPGSNSSASAVPHEQAIIGRGVADRKPSISRLAQAGQAARERQLDPARRWSYGLEFGILLLICTGVTVALFRDVRQLPGLALRSITMEQEQTAIQVAEFSQFLESEEVGSSAATPSLDLTPISAGARQEKLIEQERAQSDHEQPLSEIVQPRELAIRQRSAGDLDGALPGMDRTPVSKSDDEGTRSRLPTGRRADESSAVSVRSAVAAARRQRLEGDLVGANSTIQQALQQMRDAEDLLPLQSESSIQQDVVAARDREVARLRNAAVRQRRAKDFPAAIRIVDSALALEADNSDLQRLRSELAAEHKASEILANEIARLADAAIALREQGDLVAAVTHAEQALALDTDNTTMRSLHAALLEQSRAVEERGREVARLVTTARQQRTSGDLSGAMQDVEKALALDGKATEPMVLRTELLAERLAMDRRDREVARLRETASRRRVEGNLSGAILVVQQALVLDDSSTALQALQAELVAERRSLEERQRVLAQLRETAAVQRSEGDLAGAVQNIEQALALDEGNAELVALRADLISERKANDDRDQEIASLYVAAEQQRAEGDLTGAIAALRQALSLAPDRLNLAALESQLVSERQLSDERSRSTIWRHESARQGPDDGEHTAAVAVDKQLRSVEPQTQNAQATRSGDAVERRPVLEAVSAAPGRGTARFSAGNLEETIESLARALGLNAEDPSIQSLESELLRDVQQTQAPRGVSTEQAEVANLPATTTGDRNPGVRELVE
jgi:type II secretory pathway predicted ATPase ExeA/tetratricopeptide (TPR) repeat protein